jgi:hypothetical protein
MSYSGPLPVAHGGDRVACDSTPMAGSSTPRLRALSFGSNGDKHTVTRKEKQVETLKGNGKVYEGNRFLCDVRYCITVIQQWDRAGDQWLEGYRRIEGYVRSRTEDAVRTEDATPPELEGKREVALHIEGQPPLYFFITDPDTGRFAITRDWK